MYQYVSITIILNHDYDSIYWNHHISSSFISIHVAQMPQRDTVAGDATSKSWPDQHSCESKALWGFKLEISNASSPAWGQKRATHFGCTFSYYMCEQIDPCSGLLPFGVPDVLIVKLVVPWTGSARSSLLLAGSWAIKASHVRITCMLHMRYYWVPFDTPHVRGVLRTTDTREGTLN